MSWSSRTRPDGAVVVELPLFDGLELYDGGTTTEKLVPVITVTSALDAGRSLPAGSTFGAAAIETTPDSDSITRSASAM